MRGILGFVGAPGVCAFAMAAVVQLVERPIVAWEVAGSSPVSRPVSVRVVVVGQGKPELVPFGLVRGFLLLSCGKVAVNARLRLSSRTGVRRDHVTRVRPAGKLAFCCGVAPPLLLLPRVRRSRAARRFVCRVTRLRGGMNHVNVL